MGNGDIQKEAQRLTSIGSLFSRKTRAVAHFADIISETSDINDDTKTNAQRSLFFRKPGAAAHFADIVSETSDLNVPGPCINAASKPKTPYTESSPKQLTTEVETIQIDSEDETDTAPTASIPQITDPNNPYAYKCKLSQEKLDKLAEDDDEQMDDDSLKAFLNILRIESGKPVILVSSHYRKRVLRLGLTKSLYDGDLKNFETAIIPIHMPNTEAAHWVLGIYRRNVSILYFDSIGITYGMVKSKDGMTLELVTNWISETLKSAVRDITRGTHLDPKIEAVSLDGPQFDHHLPKYRINPQMDGVNCGFHIALIAESFLMNNGEVFLENFDIATERTRILDILSGLRDDNYRYIPRDAHNTPKDADIHLEIQESNNAINASDKISDFCKIATMEKETVAKSVKNDHEKAPVPENMNQLVENVEAFTLENGWLKASNKEQSPGSVTNSDATLPNPEQEIEVNTLPIATDQQPILCKGTEIPEMPDPEANGQPKTTVQRENLSRHDTVDDTNKKENEKPKSNNESSANNEDLRKKVQKLEETLAKFQEQMKQLQFDVRSKVTSQTVALENGRPELEQNHSALAIAETSSTAMPDYTYHPAFTDCQPTLLSIVNQQSDITEESIEKQQVAHVEVHVSDVACANMTTPQASNNGNIRLSQQNEVHTSVDPNGSNNIMATVTSVSIQTETPSLNSANGPNKQIRSRMSKPPIMPQEHFPDDKMPLKVSVKSRKQKHDLPLEIKRIRLSRTEQNLAQIQGDNSLSTSIVDGQQQHQNGLGESAAVGEESEYEFEQSSDGSESDDDENEYRLESGTEKTLTNKARTHDSRKINHRESNEIKLQSNSKAKVRTQLNKKRQLDVGPKRAVNGEKRVRKFKGRQKRYFDGEHKCKLCRYATNLKPNLARHMLAHTGNKPYHCQMCNYASSQICHLKVHERIHSGEKPYKCRLCNYAATQRHSLIEHIRIYTGEKLYTCRFCQFASSNSSSLNQHMRTQHKGTLKLYTENSKNNVKRNMLKIPGKED